MSWQLILTAPHIQNRLTLRVRDYASKGRDSTVIVIVLCSWNRMSTHVNDNAASCDQVFATLPNETYTLAIQLGNTLEADKYNSVFMGMMEQVGKLRSSN